MKSNVQEMKIKILNHELSFFTDIGVFSKEAVDYGTQVLIKNCEIKPEYTKVLDLGCGYGPIGISLAKEFPSVSFDLVDVNLRALELAKKNKEKNKLKNITIFESNVYKNIYTKYDCILTNPPIRAGKVVVHQILEESINYLNDKGCIYVVIQKKQGAPSAKDKLFEIFGNCVIICKDKGYYVLKSEKNQ